MTEKTFKDMEHSGWLSKAAAYDDVFARITSQAFDAMLDSFGDLAGKQLLDTACGTGHLVAEAHRRGAQAQGSDFADTMLVKARANYPELRFEFADAENLSYEDASFDAVACNFGILHFGNADGAIAEAHRVLKEDGIYAFTVWCGPDHGHDFMRLVLGAVNAHGNLDVELPAAPPMFRFADPAECDKAVRQAGFKESNVTQLELVWLADRPEDIIELIYKAIVRTHMLLEAQTKKNRELIHAAILDGAEAFRSGRKIKLAFPAIMTVARK